MGSEYGFCCMMTKTVYIEVLFSFLACPEGLLFEISSEWEAFRHDFLGVKFSSTDVLPEHSLMPPASTVET